MLGSRFEATESLPVSAVVLDAAGTIVGVNARWRQSSRDNGFAAPACGVGLNYLDICERSPGGVSKVAGDLRALLSGRLRALTCAYPGHTASG